MVTPRGKRPLLRKCVLKGVPGRTVPGRGSVPRTRLETGFDLVSLQENLHI